MLNLTIFLILCLIWGSTWLAIKIGLEVSPPYLGAGFRFAIATIFLYLLTWLFRKWDFSFGKLWRHIIIAGLLTYPIAYSLVYWGEQYMESGLAAVLFATMPFFVALLAHLSIKGEQLTFLKIFGMLIGFAGIILIFADNFNVNGSMGALGMVCMVASSLSAAWGTVIMKKHLHDINPLPLTAIQTSMAAIILLLLGLCLEPLSSYRADPKTLASLFYLAIIGTSVAFSLYQFLLKRMEATKLSLIAFITPVVALILGIIYMDEHLDLMKIIGSVMVIAGVFTVVMGDRLRKSQRLKGEI